MFLLQQRTGQSSLPPPKYRMHRTFPAKAFVFVLGDELGVDCVCYGYGDGIIGELAVNFDGGDIDGRDIDGWGING